MASGDRNYDIATETTQQEILNELSELKESSKSSNRIPSSITNAVLNAANQTFEGEGRGVLYICTYASIGSNYEPTITIDGTSIGSFVGKENAFIQLEFNESFIVKRGSNTGSSYPITCNAVFYRD